ncbi:unnamed protein product [Leptosia nina]|uniref:SAYSvFN domain-containing protein n=1 Tax=Leptosia nina TaxID=320188 RepID=A0AAV1JPR7_9NEOP
MEQKLKEYRALRRRQQFIDNVKTKLEDSKQKFINFLVPNKVVDMDKKEEEVILLENEEQDTLLYNSKSQLEDSTDVTSEVSEIETLEENQESWSTKPKKQGEVSAYSVFNKDCKSIDGTLKAEQFEKEIRYGAGTVRSF